MFIKYLRIEGHDVLGQIEIDFTANTTRQFSTIILAGENGSGKTQLLNLIFEISEQFNNPYRNYELEFHVQFNEKIMIDASHEKEIKFVKVKLEKGTSKPNDPSTNYPNIIIDIIFNDDSNHTFNERVGHGGFNRTLLSYLSKMVMSKVNITLENNNEISGAFDAVIENKLVEKKRTPQDLSYEIQRILIQLNYQDGQDANEYMDNHIDRPSDEIRRKRMSRFIRAFDSMFSELKFKKIEGNKVLFEKNNHLIPVSNLSSGEKQIVFRGSEFLSVHKDSLENAIAIIDEPEISMHPKWQESILTYYQHILRNVDGEQMSQLILATHSDHVVKKGLEQDDTLIIKLTSNGSCNYYYKDSPSLLLPTTTIAEVKYHVFDLITVDFHIELYAHLMSKKQSDSTLPMNCSIKAFDNWLISMGSSIKTWTFKHTYSALSTYIRNYTDHPPLPSDTTKPKPTMVEITTSINFLKSLL